MLPLPQTVDTPLRLDASAGENAGKARCKEAASFWTFSGDPADFSSRQRRFRAHAAPLCPLRGEAASFPLSDLFLLKKAGMRLRLHRMFIHRKSEQKSTQGERRRQTSVFNAGAAIPCSAGARGRRAAQRPSGPAAQRPSGPAAQRPSGPAAQRPSGPAAQRPSGPAAQRPSGPAAQRPSGPAAQRPSGPAAQRPSGPAAQRPSGPTSPQVPSTGIRHGQGPLFLGTRAFFLGRGRCKAARHEAAGNDPAAVPVSGVFGFAETRARPTGRGRARCGALWSRRGQRTALTGGWGK